jgi:hypothetical protein
MTEKFPSRGCSKMCAPYPGRRRTNV